MALAEKSGMVSRVLAWDRLGMLLSSLCMVHCALMPVLFLLAPIGLELIEHDHFHSWIFWPVMLIAVVAFLRGYFASRQVLTLVLGAVGLLTLVLAHRFGDWWGSHESEYIFSFLGSVTLIVAHLRNIRALTHYNHHRRALGGVASTDCQACCSSHGGAKIRQRQRSPLQRPASRAGHVVR